jgi:AcrR family transcriptional regulator
VLDWPTLVPNCSSSLAIRSMAVSVSPPLVALAQRGGRGAGHGDFAVIYQYFPDKSHILAELSSETIGLLIENFDAIAAKHPAPKERLFATSRGLIQFCTAHPRQFRNVFFGPENRNGIRAGQYINDIGAPLFQRFVQLFFDVVRHEGLPGRDDIVIAHTWWYTIFGLATLMVIQGVLPDLPDQTLVVEQTIATLWAGVQVVPRLPKKTVST